LLGQEKNQPGLVCGVFVRISAVHCMFFCLSDSPWPEGYFSAFGSLMINPQLRRVLEESAVCRPLPIFQQFWRVRVPRISIPSYLFERTDPDSCFEYMRSSRHLALLNSRTPHFPTFLAVFFCPASSVRPLSRPANAATSTKADRVNGGSYSGISFCSVPSRLALPFSFFDLTLPPTIREKRP